MDPQAVNQEIFTVFVNPAIPINELMDALVKGTGCRMGNIDVPWHALKLKRSAPPTFSAETKMQLIAAPHDLSTTGAIALIGEQEGGIYRPTVTQELLVFLTTFIREQLKYPIVALGEPGDERGPIVAYAYMDDGDRKLFIGRPSPDCKWEAGYRFLAIKKDPA